MCFDYFEFLSESVSTFDPKLFQPTSAVDELAQVFSNKSVPAGPNSRYREKNCQRERKKERKEGQREREKERKKQFEIYCDCG